jgi:NADPH:quinone reductase-like Zn-dependent oxidoreductase
MQQIWMARRGGPEVLEIREVARPEPGPGEVRIRVAAAGVNFADVMMRRGLYPDAPRLPAVAGYEVAGTVDAVGRGVAAELAGRRVVAMTRFVGYSESVCVPAALAWEIPGGVAETTAAAVPVNYLTAWQMLRVMAPPADGEAVLIHSAAGGVGQAALQLARLAGARVLGTASPAKHDRLRSAGVEAVFDSRDERFAAAVREATGGRGADVVLEPRSGRWIMESYRSLAKCGRLVLFGFSSAAVGAGSGTLSALRTLARVPWLRINPISLMNDNKSVAGVNLGRMWDQGERTGRWMDALLGLLAEGRLTPVIDGVLPFSRVAEAHARLEQRLNVGKIVLVPDGKEESV